MAQLPREIDPNAPKGRLFGRVTCTQTGLPLAGAAIHVQGAPPATDEVFGLRELGVTDENGNFDFPPILASTYYIFATLPGYASPASLLSRDKGFDFGIPYHIDARIQDMDAALDRVTVTPATPAEIHLSLLAGSAISGKVFWLDGSPATYNELKFSYVHADDSRRGCYREPEEYTNGRTDGDGNFHLGGLFPGRYIVGARAPKLLDYVRKNLMWNGVPPTINCASFYLWTGGTPDSAKATPVEVGADMEVPNVNLTLPMLRPTS